MFNGFAWLNHCFSEIFRKRIIQYYYDKNKFHSINEPKSKLRCEFLKFIIIIIDSLQRSYCSRKLFFSGSPFLFLKFHINSRFEFNQRTCYVMQTIPRFISTNSVIGLSLCSMRYLFDCVTCS